MTSSATAPKKPGPRQAHNDKYHNFKVCRTCNVEKRMADFTKTGLWRKKRAADPKRYRLDCKECCRAPDGAKVDPNWKPVRSRRVFPKPRTPEEKKAYERQYKRRARRATRIKALSYLAEKGCEECGERDPRVLEFDHLEPCKKEHNVSSLLADGYSWGAEKLREEIRKCRVLCANCHRKHTIAQQDHYSHPEIRAALRAIYADHDIAE